MSWQGDWSRGSQWNKPYNWSGASSSNWQKGKGWEDDNSSSQTWQNKYEDSDNDNWSNWQADDDTSYTYDRQRSRSRGKGKGSQSSASDNLPAETSDPSAEEVRQSFGVAIMEAQIEEANDRRKAALKSKSYQEVINETIVEGIRNTSEAPLEPKAEEVPSETGGSSSSAPKMKQWAPMPPSSKIHPTPPPPPADSRRSRGAPSSNVAEEADDSRGAPPMTVRLIPAAIPLTPNVDPRVTPTTKTEMRIA